MEAAVAKHYGWGEERVTMKWAEHIKMKFCGQPRCKTRVVKVIQKVGFFLQSLRRFPFLPFVPCLRLTRVGEDRDREQARCPVAHDNRAQVR